MSSNKRIVYVLFCIVYLFFCKNCFCQYDFNWRVGLCTVLDFNSGGINITPQIDTLSLAESNTCISKTDSSFAAFSNATVIYRSDGTKMPNGDSLAPTHYSMMFYPLGLPSSQGCLFLNKPGSDSLIYLIHEAIDNDSLSPITSNIYYTILDLSADSGKGVVISKNNMLYQSSDSLMHGKLQAIKHANGNDWWLISKQQYRNEILEWLIKPDSILGPFLVSFSGNVGLDSYRGQATVSNDGTKYAIIYWNQCLQLFDFDRCTGNFNLIFNNNLNDNSGPGGGVAFSESGNYFYATTSYFCCQFNMLSADIYLSKKVIEVFDGLIVNGGYCDFQQCRLAPDGKIYISAGSTNYLWSRINFPELPDTAADVEQHVVQLYCDGNASFPNLPNFNLGALPPNICNSTVYEYPERSLGITIYPNPATTYFSMSGKLNYPITLTIFEIGNKKLESFKIYSGTKINIEHLSKGLYFLEIIDKEGDNNYIKLIKE